MLPHRLQHTNSTGSAGGGGTLWSWADNTSGELGLGNTANVSSPTQVGAFNWLQVTAGGTWTGTHTPTLGIRANGTLWGWGNNEQGPLGLNHIANVSSPAQVGSDTNWAKVSVSGQHTIAVKTDGTLWTWGLNSSGQLGTNSTAQRSSPAQVGSLTNWADVTTNGIAINNAATVPSIALKTDGTLWAWGGNGYGQLGLNSTANVSSPTIVGALTNWAKVLTGARHTLAIKTDGTLWVWGSNDNGQLGRNNTASTSSPVQLGALATWVDVAAGTHHSLAVTADGTLWAWGRNQVGQLGQADTISRSSPSAVGTSLKWSKVSAGGFHSVAITKSGTLYGWGYNAGEAPGAVGDSTTVHRSSPTQVGTETKWISIETGTATSFGIKV